MTRVQHFDRLELHLDASTVRVVVGGDMVVQGIGARVGPYTYHDDKGDPFVELVPPETLFEQASLDSAAGSDVTIKHPPGLVTEDNYRDVTHGAWTKAWDAGGGKLGVELRLKTADAKAMLRAALDNGAPVELSPAYEVDVVATPGRTDQGRYDAVQHERRYNAIALLGPGEARGGEGMRLQLDGPECAPKGSRIQVSRVRLDSSARKALQSDTKSRITMKHAIIRSDGFKPRTITGAQLAGLRTVVTADAIEKGTVTISIEGEEPDEFILPVSMIEMLLEGIGASSAAPAADPMAEEMGAEEQLEAQDASADEEEKTDSKIAREVARQLDARDHINSRTATVNSDAARLLPPGYSYSVPWTQVALDAIAKADPDAVTRARTLAKDARTNPVAEGRLLELLSSYAARASGSGGSRLTLGEPPSHADGLDNPLPPHARSKDA